MKEMGLTSYRFKFTSCLNPISFIKNSKPCASGLRKALGRFSIGWTRILPEGTGARNPDGIQYYHNLIGEFDLDFDIILHFFSRVTGKRYCPGSDSLPLGFATSPAGHCLIKLLNALLLGSMYFWSWFTWVLKVHQPKKNENLVSETKMILLTRF